MIKTRKNKEVIWFSAGNTFSALSTVLMLMIVSRLTNVQTTGEFAIALAIAQLLLRYKGMNLILPENVSSTTKF